MSAAAIGAIGAAAVQAAGTIFGSKMNYKKTLKLQEKQNEFNKEQNDIAYQRNLEQWHRENEYNSPSAQMQRYAEAGLNANLVYGQQNTSASSPTANAIQQHGGAANFSSPPLFPANIAQNYQNLKTQELQQQALTEQINTQRALQDSYKAQTFLNNMRGQKEVAYSGTWQQQAQTSLEALQYKNAYMQQQIQDIIFNNEQLNPIRQQLLDWTAKQKQQAYNFHEKINPLQVSQLMYNIDRTSAEIEKIYKQSALAQKQINWYDDEHQAALDNILSRTGLNNKEMLNKYFWQDFLSEPLSKFGITGTGWIEKFIEQVRKAVENQTGTGTSF